MAGMKWVREAVQLLTSLYCCAVMYYSNSQNTQSRDSVLGRWYGYEHAVPS